MAERCSSHEEGWATAQKPVESKYPEHAPWNRESDAKGRRAGTLDPDQHGALSGLAVTDLGDKIPMSLHPWTTQISTMQARVQEAGSFRSI